MTCNKNEQQDAKNNTEWTKTTLKPLKRLKQG